MSYRQKYLARPTLIGLSSDRVIKLRLQAESSSSGCWLDFCWHKFPDARVISNWKTSLSLSGYTYAFAYMQRFFLFT